MLRVHMAGGPTGQVDGSMHNEHAHKNITWKELCALPQQSTHGATFGTEISFIPLRQPVGMQYMAKGVY